MEYFSLDITLLALTILALSSYGYNHPYLWIGN